MDKSAGTTAVVSHFVPAKYGGGLIVATDRVTAPTAFSCPSTHLIDSPALAKWSPLRTDDSVSNRAVDSLHQTFRLA